jgi:hypothetical protein
VTSWSAQNIDSLGVDHQRKRDWGKKYRAINNQQMWQEAMEYKWGLTAEGRAKMMMTCDGNGNGSGNSDYDGQRQWGWCR